MLLFRRTKGFEINISVFCYFAFSNNILKFQCTFDDFKSLKIIINK